MEFYNKCAGFRYLTALKFDSDYYLAQLERHWVRLQTFKERAPMPFPQEGDVYLRLCLEQSRYMAEKINSMLNDATNPWCCSCPDCTLFYLQKVSPFHNPPDITLNNYSFNNPVLIHLVHFLIQCVSTSLDKKEKELETLTLLPPPALPPTIAPPPPPSRVEAVADGHRSTGEVLIDGKASPYQEGMMEEDDGLRRVVEAYWRSIMTYFKCQRVWIC
jgi:hypothetical protein